VIYRRLAVGEASLLGTIDRRESIDGVYLVESGRLVFQARTEEVRGWDPGELDAYIERLRSLLGAGGVAWSAWHDAMLVGLGSLDVRPIASRTATFKLDMLYVSAPYRNQRIGSELLSRLKVEARARGASALYVSATPTRNTVDAYLRLGARLVGVPDPELLHREPEDIYLELDT
jgi:GNAT superfamily N-acetyltransferase